MPEKKTLERARKDEREGKATSTQASEFVREEFHHIREGKHGARSPKQAIAIGLSKARRAGVDLPPPKRGQSDAVKHKAEQDYEKGQKGNGDKPVSRRRSQAVTRVLQREGHGAASKSAISRQARQRGPANRSQAARKAARTRKSES